MKHLVILPNYTYAGHCTNGKSNKDWVACLAIELDKPMTTIPEIREQTEVIFLSIYGAHGSSLVKTSPQRLTMSSAKKLFANKCREKAGKFYAPVPFAPYLSAFGEPLGLSLTLTTTGQATRTEERSSALAEGTALGYLPSAAKPIKWQDLQQRLSDHAYGLTEKANGHRCLVVFDGLQLHAYNRKGQRTAVPPEGAKHLRRLGVPFVIDGERLLGEQAGQYVIFDLLEWDSENFTTYAYSKRIGMLQQAMVHAGLLHKDRATPTYQQAHDNSTVADLTLLVTVTGAELATRVLADVLSSGGEGIILRHLSGDYLASPLKYKFLEDIDAFVIGINEGPGGGSLKFGLVRPSDRAIIEVANVRSGFNATDIQAVREMLARKEQPVFKITYLPPSTPGIQLVQPKSGMNQLRIDKSAQECTSEQFGPEKARFIADAKPVKNIGKAVPLSQVERDERLLSRH